MQIHRSTSIVKRVNLTPLIDVIFLLIVFFLFTSEFSAINVMHVDIASKTSVSKVARKSDLVTLMISKSDFVSYEGREYRLKDMSRFFQQHIDQYQQREFIVMAQTDAVTVQDMVHVIDSLKTLGINHIMLMNKEGG